MLRDEVNVDISEEPPPTTFSSLPAELLVHALVGADSVHDLGAAMCTCVELRALVERALRMRAAHQSASDGVQLLCWRERRRAMSCGRHVPIAAGSMHSAFADTAGRLYTCGSDVNSVGLLGLGSGKLPRGRTCPHSCGRP